MLGLLAVLLTGTAAGSEFRTNDPLKAFVRGEYPPGDDYFINGSAETHLFRCALTKNTEGFQGVALSEISIWGNRTGPWEIFKQEDGGSFVYVGTKHLADTACLESCRSKDYLTSGQCRWQRGWPKP
jgi:hypothetical protein